jgi:hypothetical protein
MEDAMEPKNLKKQIEDNKSTLARLQSSSEKMIPDIEKILLNYLLEWTDIIIEGVKRDKPEIIMSMGKENITQFKSEIESLKTEYPRIISKKLSGIDWPHRREIPNNIQAGLDFKQYFDSSLDNVLRVTIGGVGEILKIYAFVKPGTSLEWTNDERGRISYGFGLPRLDTPSEKEYAGIKSEYSRLINEQMPIIMELIKLIQEEKRNQAEDLWKQA